MQKRRIIPALAGLLWLLLAGAGARAEAEPPRAGTVVFVAGAASIAGRAAALDAPVREGDEILTGADGHLYIRTADDGYLILRPASRARVVVWRANPDDPAATRVKIVLDAGVARNITGRAVKAARQNFRFNTPVAAIGVRGTDFTVFTDARTTRVAVASGGIVASPFGVDCTPMGNGPCGGAASLALLAEQAGLLLQIEQGWQQPRLLPINGNAPDHLAPPHREEPSRAGAGHAARQGPDELEPQRAADVLAAATAAPPPPARQIHWGRWRALAGQPTPLDIAGVLAGGGELLAINSWFAILRGPGPDWQKPAAGALDFALAGSEAWIVHEPTQTLRPGQIENARLRIDFGRSSFATGFELVGADNERHRLQAQGHVTADGRLQGDSQFRAPTNMAVAGAVNGASAAYLFQGRIDNQRLATGATAWQRP